MYRMIVYCASLPGGCNPTTDSFPYTSGEPSTGSVAFLFWVAYASQQNMSAYIQTDQLLINGTVVTYDYTQPWDWIQPVSSYRECHSGTGFGSGTNKCLETELYIAYDNRTLQPIGSSNGMDDEVYAPSGAYEFYFNFVNATTHVAVSTAPYLFIDIEEVANWHGLVSPPTTGAPDTVRTDRYCSAANVLATKNVNSSDPCDNCATNGPSLTVYCSAQFSDVADWKAGQDWTNGSAWMTAAAFTSDPCLGDTNAYAAMEQVYYPIVQAGVLYPSTNTNGSGDQFGLTGDACPSGVNGLGSYGEPGGFQFMVESGNIPAGEVEGCLELVSDFVGTPTTGIPAWTTELVVPYF